MKRYAAVVAGLALALSVSGMARAGIYTDDMSKCLVKATTPGDRQDLILWIYEAMSKHPAVAAMSNVTQAQHDATDKKVADLLVRLLLQDCRSQTVDAIKYEGAGALQQSFGVLGQVAMAGLMAEPSVSKSVAGLSRYVDQDKLKALMSDAGLPQPPSKN